MRPDEIKQFIGANYSNIIARPRRSPYGWSFFYGEVRRGPYSTRIARAVDDGLGGTDFKLSATSRLKGKNVSCKITSKNQLRGLFDQELSVWKRNFKV